MTTPTYEAPGPGTWEQDPTHFPRPVTPFVEETFLEGFVRGFSEGSARYGVLLSHIEPAVVNGFVYNQMVGVDPDDAEEFERRAAAAERTVQSKLWREDLDLWDQEFKPDSIRRNRALESVDVSELDTDALVDHLEAVRDNAREMMYRHHKWSFTAILPVGMYLASALQWTGLDAGELLAPLKGSSPVSLGAQEELRRLAAAMSAVGLTRDNYRGPAQETIDGLSARDDEVGEAMRAFSAAVGARLAGGYDVADPCALELPEMLVGTIWSALEASGGPAVDDWAEAAAHVRRAVPEEHREQFDELLSEARHINRLRDERGIYNDNWATGIARIAILETGRRLAESGRIHDAESALDTTREELAAMLQGAAEPSADELAARTARRVDTPLSEAPPFFGPAPEPPPPLDGLPPHVAQLMGAVGAAMGEVFGHGPPPTDEAVTGRPVSPGVYIGSARVIDHPRESNRIQQGDVLVTGSTSAAFNVVLPLLGAIVTDRGGQLSHAAIVAREYGIPAVVGTTKATTVIPDGARVKVDGTAGTVELV